MADLILRIQSPDQPPRTIKLLEGLSLGRDPGNRIVLQDPNVSSRHARIVKTAEGLAIEDLGSANLTRFSDGVALGNLLKVLQALGLLAQVEKLLDPHDDPETVAYAERHLRPR